jgi:hypothetical protein
MHMDITEEHINSMDRSWIIWVQTKKRKIRKKD